MNDPLKNILIKLKDTQNIRGVELPIGLEFLQLVVTGPPGAGKSYYIDQIGGWPNEGYIDLTRKGWWKDQSLTFRPREVHLGLPFKGFKDAITVFDKEWLDSPTPPHLDLKRIKLPPAKDGHFRTNWNARYIFEFLLPNAETIFEQRQCRQEDGYFPVDDDLTFEMVEQQLNVYRETALYLHRAGVSVYVRRGLSDPPMIIMEKGSGNVPFWSVSKRPERPSLTTLAGLRWLLFRHNPIHWIDISHEPTILKKTGRLAHDGRGFELTLGKQSFFIQPETPLGIPKKETEKNWTLNDSRYCSTDNISPFYRLQLGETTILGHSNKALSDTIKLKESVADRHVSVSNVRGDLVFTPLDNSATTSLKRLDDLDQRERLEGNRYASFIAIRKLMDGPVKEVSSEIALASLRQVNEYLHNEPHRPLNKEGTAGGLLQLGESPNSLIVGDLHAQVDNLLKVLTENCTLQSLRKGTVCLIILGDAIHSEVSGQMENMEESVLLMDIIIQLKKSYPQQVHYIRGNHDSFDASLSKNGISQGILHKQYLLDNRGEEYVNEMQTFWDRIPFIISSDDFITCHAGPPRYECKKEDYINIYTNAKLIKEITTNRVERPNYMKGYNKKDIKQFRTSLGATKGTPVIVGHTPLDPFASVWNNAGAIKNHHIIYSAHSAGPTIFVQSFKKMVPISYPHEPLTKLINKIR